MVKFYKYAPHLLQNIAITLYNRSQYRVRYANMYQYFKTRFKKNKHLTLQELKAIQLAQVNALIQYAKSNAAYYKKILADIKPLQHVDDLQQIPLLTKKILQENSTAIRTISLSKGKVFETGGTTGVSLQTVYTKENVQQRFAMLDTFRSAYGYALGKKTAWFSGKHIVTAKDVRKHRFWKTDYYYNIRYYSTFHLKNDYLKYYLENLIQYKPQFLIGYPNSMFEIAKYGVAHGYDFPANTITAIFPTAESFPEYTKTLLESFFKTKAYNQYASSEGAPFIMECPQGNMHMELQSGVFEVLDTNNRPAKSGRLVVTSFTSYGTPLIRYDIGDNVTLKDGTCTCGNHNPMIEKITGRTNDFIFSKQKGVVHQVRIADTVKKVHGIKNFQVIQDSLDALLITIVIDKRYFTSDMEKLFIQNWKDRVGDAMEIKIFVKDEIRTASSGKYQMVINNIKHLLD